MLKTAAISDEPAKSFENLCLAALRMVGTISGTAKFSLRERVASRMDPSQTFEADIWVEDNLGDGSVQTCFVECKYLGRPVQRDRVQILADTREQVGANRAIIISCSGFSDGAIKLAYSKNIELIYLHVPRRPDSFANWLFSRSESLSVVTDRHYTHLKHIGEESVLREFFDRVLLIESSIGNQQSIWNRCFRLLAVLIDWVFLGFASLGFAPRAQVFVSVGYAPTSAFRNGFIRSRSRSTIQAARMAFQFELRRFVEILASPYVHRVNSESASNASLAFCPASVTCACDASEAALIFRPGIHVAPCLLVSVSFVDGVTPWANILTHDAYILQNTLSSVIFARVNLDNSKATTVGSLQAGVYGFTATTLLLTGAGMGGPIATTPRCEQIETGAYLLVVSDVGCVPSENKPVSFVDASSELNPSNGQDLSRQRLVYGRISVVVRDVGLVSDVESKFPACESRTLPFVDLKNTRSSLTRMPRTVAEDSFAE